MVEYRDLNAPPSQTMAEIVAGLKEKAESSKTGAAGVKDLGYYGNIVWNRADGDSLVSIRDIDNGLDEARDRISDALQESAEAMLRADEAKIESGEAQGRLDELDEVTLPAIRDEIAEGSGSTNFYQPEPPLPTDDPAPVEGDLWFDTNDQNKPYIYRDLEWLSARDDSFLSTARNLTPWGAAGDPHAVSGQVSTIPEAEMKVQSGVMPGIPEAEGAGIVLHLDQDSPNSTTTTTLPFQGQATTAYGVLAWDEAAMPYEGRPIGVSGTAYFCDTGTGSASPSIVAEAVFFDAAGSVVGLSRSRLTVTARDLDPEDPAESAPLDAYGLTHIAEIEGVLEPNTNDLDTIASFAMAWHVRLPRVDGNTALISTAEARVQVPESGIAAGAITTPKIAVGAITADSGIIGSLDVGVVTAGQMVGEHLVAGTVDVSRLNVTEEMAAQIVLAMDIETKKLVVTEEAILNHATLIGQTVVDDINVQGKLIGEDGVFTGTVDFANVNVTGEAVAEKLTGKTIVGANISTPSSGGRSIALSNTARDGWPAVSFETPGMARSASLAAYDGIMSDQGIWQNGSLVLNSGRSGVTSGTTSAVAARPGGVRLIGRDAASNAVARMDVSPSLTSMQHSGHVLRLTPSGASFSYAGQPFNFQVARREIYATVTISVPGYQTGHFDYSWGAGIFTQPPLVFLTKQSGQSARGIPYVDNITLTGCRIGIYDPTQKSTDASTVILAVHAVQQNN